MGIFGLELESNIVIQNQHPRIYILVKFSKKTKMFTFTTKMPYLGIFELKFENFVIFETSFLEFIKLENFGKKNKNA